MQYLVSDFLGEKVHHESGRILTLKTHWHAAAPFIPLVTGRPFILLLRNPKRWVVSVKM